VGYLSHDAGGCGIPDDGVAYPDCLTLFNNPEMQCKLQRIEHGEFNRASKPGGTGSGRYLL